MLFLLWVGLTVLGCTRMSSRLPSFYPPVPPSQAEKPTPRVLASLQLTEQARILLQDGKPDGAINLLERAISLNPINGKNYYYLAEAWFLKGNTKQAQEFNTIAGIYLEEDSEWMIRVIQQRDRIRKDRK